MEQLSGLDNASLVSEKGNVFSHVCTLLVYDVTTAPGAKVRYKDILQHFEERLHLHPVFSNRLATVPFGIDRPYWVAGGDIDLEYHIRHIALPRPGDWRQLMIQVARLHSRPLDRNKPLWEVYVIEGLDNIPKLPKGAFAIFFKVHHASVDGMAAVHLLSDLHTKKPEKAHAHTRKQEMLSEVRPSNYTMLSNTVGHNLARVGKTASLVAGSTRRLIKAATEQLRDLSPGKLGEVSRSLSAGFDSAAPVTRFSRHVSPNRVVEGFGMPISRIKRIRAKVPGITLNDIFIAVAAGAVRNYLQEKGELPGESLTGLMPISLRSDASAGGNQVAGIPVTVCSNIADPIERVKAIHLETLSGKEAAEKLGLDMIMNVLDVVPPLLAKALIDRMMLPRINIAVSNVRGPDHDMYLAGAKAMCFYPVSIPADGAGLNFTGISYNGVMWVSMVACRDMVPDPNFMLTCMQGAWDELLAAADALPGEKKTGSPVTGKPARKRPKTRQVKTTARAQKSSPVRKTAASRRKSAKK
ncbi:MAG: wax ester/triacylglycerol synthase family O-acyltransferase [Gammaproteobacteria bacterium]|nr:wax ester/triacylglycerol synthase family O-acyltransferase [Gammaproteobacteria bacterium]